MDQVGLFRTKERRTGTFRRLAPSNELPVLLMMLLQVHITRPWEVQGELGRQLEEWCPQLLP